MIGRLWGLRWWMMGLLMVGSIVNYLTRSTLAVAAPSLLKDLAIGEQQYSWILSAFQLAIMLQPICGYVMDTIGLKFGFAIFAIAWSFVSMAHGLAANWQTLFSLRAPHAFTRISTSSSAIAGTGISTTESFVYSDRSSALIRRSAKQGLNLRIDRKNRQRSEHQRGPDQRRGPEPADADRPRQHPAVQRDQHERIQKHHRAASRRGDDEQRERLRHAGEQDRAPQAHHPPHQPEVERGSRICRERKSSSRYRRRDGSCNR